MSCLQRLSTPRAWWTGRTTKTITTTTKSAPGQGTERSGSTWTSHGVHLSHRPDRGLDPQGSTVDDLSRWRLFDTRKVVNKSLILISAADHGKEHIHLFILGASNGMSTTIVHDIGCTEDQRSNLFSVGRRTHQTDRHSVTDRVVERRNRMLTSGQHLVCARVRTALHFRGGNTTRPDDATDGCRFCFG